MATDCFAQLPLDSIANHRFADAPADDEAKPCPILFVTIRRQDHERVRPRAALLPHSREIQRARKTVLSLHPVVTGPA